MRTSLIVNDANHDVVFVEHFTTHICCIHNYDSISVYVL